MRICLSSRNRFRGLPPKRSSKLARGLNVVIIGSLFERRAAGIYHNTAAVLDADGSLLGKYRKMHIPDDPLYYEKFYFTPGDLGFPNFDTRFARIGVLVCWDQWYPEGARLSSLGGANILFYPTAIGWHPSEKQEFGAAQLDAWRTIQRSHAIANGVFVAAVNRVGFEGTPRKRPGILGPFVRLRSVRPDARGGFRGQGRNSDRGMRSQSRVEEVRRNWPFLRDRRIDAYSPILDRWLE